jgi:superfamily II DNA or RNA helicase
MEAKFKTRDLVQRVNQPETVGVVLESCWDDQTDSWTYRVQFGGVITAVPETSLRGWIQATTAWEKMDNSEFSGIDHFRDTLTFHKVKSPTARVAHAFATARTLFFPHQFKPLLKFLDGGGSGILIADDVGLGKTIEAGYILRELQARKNLERIVVIAPARLATKWKREMAQRFEESFEIVKGAKLIELSNALERGSEVAPFRWIISYEGSRSKNVREALLSGRPALDFLIVDEAHRLRNTGTQQHNLGQLLCDLADFRVFLTATPVQNKLDDLWSLLRLLSEDQFPDREIFYRQVRANQKVLESQSHLFQYPPELKRASQVLSELIEPEGFAAPASTEFLTSIFQRLDNENISPADLVELNSDIASLNTLGHIISRTRKTEAMPGCARREAVWCKVELTEPERRIYESVERLCTTASDSGPSQSWGMQMAMLMAYRVTASCIPAAIRYFDEKIEANNLHRTEGLDYYFEDGDLATEEAEHEDPNDDLSSWFDTQRNTLRKLVDFWQSNGGVDSKFDRLREALLQIWEEDDQLRIPRRKVVVFSFFRKTLEYLQELLDRLDIGARMIHGLISLDERERGIDEFLTRNDVHVLLTSEVGGEGIDLQKASVVFNYDLPWNPMVVEQRIGRVDRIGQLAERIVIVNFVVGGSVEEQILQRLLDKIGIFESSIGEIEPIIGDQIEALTRRVLSGKLSDEELEQNLLREERAIASRKVDANRIRGEAEKLFTSDQSLIDEIGALIGEKQVPSEKDLLRFVNRFLGRRYPGYLIPERSLSEVQRVTLSPKLAREMENASRELGNELTYFSKKVAAGEFAMTFSREIAYRHAYADLIHFNHPLVQFIIQELTGSFGNESFSLAISKSSILETGLYGFAMRMVEVDGPIPRNRLEMVVADICSDRCWTEKRETNSILLEILESGESVEPAERQRQARDEVKARLYLNLDRAKSDLENREIRLAKGRLEQRRAISIRLAELKLRRAKDQLERMIDSGAKDFAIKMGRLKTRKAEQELAAALSANNEDVPVGIASWTDIAVGFLTVGM